MARERPAAAETLRQADTVRAELNAALADAGVPLPSLRVDPLSWAEEEPRPLIELGRCNLATARALTAALRAGGGTAER
jgi:hypothetical protein